MRFIIGWISFTDNELHMRVINAVNKQEALKVAYKCLTDTDYDPESGDDQDIKQAAFDCDGIISALEI